MRLETEFKDWFDRLSALKARAEPLFPNEDERTEVFVDVLDLVSEIIPKVAVAGLLGGRESSPEISSLAAKYLGMDPADFRDAVVNEVADDQVWGDIKRLAASVLSQDETKGQE